MAGMYPRPGAAKPLGPRDEPDALADLGERALGDGLGAVRAGLEHVEGVGLVRLEFLDARLDRRQRPDHDLAEVGLEVGVALALVAALDVGDGLAGERTVDVEQVRPVS